MADADLQTLLSLYKDATRDCAASSSASSGPSRGSWSALNSCIGSSGSRESAGASDAIVSDQRSGAGVASVVLPVEQHSGRRAARRAARESFENRGVLEQQVRRMLADPRADALVNNFVGQWLFLRNLPTVLPDPRKDPDFDEDLRQGFRRETELFAGSILREDRSVLELLTAELHIRERAAGAALRHPEHPRDALPPRRADRRQSPRPAGSRKRAVVTSYPESHVAGRPGQVDSRESARHAAASTAAGCAGAEGEAEPGGGKASRCGSGSPQHRANPVVRELPRDDGSARPVARELRFRRDDGAPSTKR